MIDQMTETEVRQACKSLSEDIERKRKRITLLEAERDDAQRVMREACEANRVYVSRIEELKAKVTSLQLIEKHLLQCCKDHKSRIEVLEARIDKALKHLPERAGMAMGFLLEDNEEVT